MMVDTWSMMVNGLLKEPLDVIRRFPSMGILIWRFPKNSTNSNNGNDDSDSICLHRGFLKWGYPKMDGL